MARAGGWNVLKCAAAIICGAVAVYGCTSSALGPTSVSASSAPPTSLNGELNRADEDFLVAAIEHHDKLIYLAGVGIERATDPAVKAISGEIQAELAPRLETLREVLTTRGRSPAPQDPAAPTIAPETLPPPIDVFAFAELGDLNGRDFDRRYIDYLTEEFKAILTAATIAQADGADLDAMTEGGTSAKAALVRLDQLSLLRFSLDLPPPTTLPPVTLLPGLLPVPTGDTIAPAPTG
jgi:uncharacterized protein (DUF305 family)